MMCALGIYYNGYKSKIRKLQDEQLFAYIFFNKQVNVINKSVIGKDLLNT